MKDEPQAVLIRSLKDIAGPGKVARELIVDGSFYGEKIFSSERIWLEEGMSDIRISEGPRIGIDYAGEYWKNVNWRFYISI
jgi:DNA-3-methyladenine glycosylase